MDPCPGHGSSLYAGRSAVTYTVENASQWPLDRLAPYMSDVLAEMGRLAKRYPGDTTTTALFQEFLAGKKTLWLVRNGETFVAIAMTTIRTVDATATRMFTLCDLAGRDVAKFADELTKAMEDSAAENDCSVIAVEGRIGWEKFLKPRGYKAHAVLYRKSRPSDGRNI